MSAAGHDRPGAVVVVAGTGTEIGKTWVAAELALALVARGLQVRARKPAQSLAPGESPTDAEALAAATGEDPTAVCPPRHTYQIPMAPPMAADALGVAPPTIDDLAATVRWPPGTDVGLVETAGGVASPQAADGDVTDLVGALGPDGIVLVADAGLGTIHAVRSSLAVLADASPPVAVHLNRFDPTVDLHRRNLAWLVDHAALAPTTTVDELVEVVLAWG